MVVVDDVGVVVIALQGGVLVVLDVFLDVSLDVSSEGRRSAWCVLRTPRDNTVMSTSVLVVNIRGIIIAIEQSVLQLQMVVGLD